MRLVVDVLGAPESSGGMRLYAQEFVKAYAREFPSDRLSVLGPKWARDEFAPLGNVDVIVRDNERFLARAYGQLVSTALVYKRSRADYLLSVSPIVSPFVPRAARACIVHDWRHLKNPAEFSLPQRLYRRLWSFSANRSGLTVAISNKTARETAAFAPRSHRVVVENGRDHLALEEKAASPATPRSDVVTFGHHNNKRPDLVIRAFAAIPAVQRRGHRLVVLGARDRYADELRLLAAESGLTDADAAFPGFVSDDEYQSIMSRAACVVLASSDEGFGLPVAEAHSLGIPAVVTSDSGLTEIFPVGPLVAEPTSESIATSISQALAMTGNPWEGVAPATWRDTAVAVRSAILSVIGNRR